MMKLIGKETINNRVNKKYGPVKTPYRRILESKLLSDEIKSSLAEEYDLIDPIELWEQKKQLTARILKIAGWHLYLRQRFPFSYFLLWGNTLSRIDTIPRAKAPRKSAPEWFATTYSIPVFAAPSASNSWVQLLKRRLNDSLSIIAFF